MGCQPIPSDFRGPLPSGSVGLVLGRSSSTLRGLVIYPGVIDSDFTGTVQILASAHRGVVSICPGDRIAQLLVLPSLHSHFPSAPCPRGEGSFGSSGGVGAYVTLELGERPTLTLQVQGKSFLGILDTGADSSVMSSRWWPSSWPTVPSTHSLQGLGYASAPAMSASRLKWRDSEGNEGSFQPYVMPIPVNLWGREVLKQMSFRLTNEFSPQSQQMMRAMGCVPGKGLGPRLQGRAEPIIPEPRPPRQGLGFS